MADHCEEANGREACSLRTRGTLLAGIQAFRRIALAVDWPAVPGRLCLFERKGFATEVHLSATSNVKDRRSVLMRRLRPYPLVDRCVRGVHLEVVLRTSFNSGDSGVESALAQSCLVRSSNR